VKRVNALPVALIVIAAFLCGCGNTRRHILKAAPQDGHAENLAVSADAAFEVAMQVCTDLGFEVFEVDEAKHTARMLGTEGKRIYVNAAIFVEETGPDSCRVSVVTQDDAGKPPGNDWTSKIIKEMKAAVCSGVQPCWSSGPGSAPGVAGSSTRPP